MQYIDPALHLQLQPKFSTTPTPQPAFTPQPAPTELTLRPQYKESDYIRFFQFYGLRLDKTNTGQLNGTCPFHDCRKVKHDSPDHFFASPSNGCWDCKYCGRRGNAYEFIRTFHSEAKSLTSGQDYYDLASNRAGIPAWVFPYFNLAKNPLNGEWLLPSYSLKSGELTNLYAWKQKATPDGPKNQVYSGPTFKQIAYGLQHFRKDHNRPVIIAEGHWDYLAGFALLYLSGMLEQYDILGTPGDVFPDIDVHLLSNRIVIHLGDNDQAGELSAGRLWTKMGQRSITPKATYRLGFRPDETKGKDTRDILAELGLHKEAQPGEVWNNFTRRLYQVNVDFKKHANEAFTPSLRMVPCDSFDDVLDCMQNEGLYMPDCLKDTFTFITAVAATVPVPGPPLWGTIIGPSGSSKTTLLSIVSPADPYCFYMSTWTGLVSGYWERGQGDMSLVPHVNNKCVCIEDLTPMLNESETVQAKLWAELREVYGGKIKKSFKGPAGIKSFEGLNFNILACVTDKIRKINNTDLGERFLQCDQDSYWTEDGILVRDGIDKGIIVASAVDSTLERMLTGQKEMYPQSKSIAWGFIDYIMCRIQDDKDYVPNKVSCLIADKDTKRLYENLGQWAAYARAFIERDKERQPTHEQRAEYGSRLSTQLVTLAISLSIILDEDPNSNRIKGLVRKIALDTAFGPQQDFMLHLARTSVGLSTSDLEKQTGKSATTVLNRLRDLGELGICVYRDRPMYGYQNRSPGNQPHSYFLSNELQDIAVQIGFGKQSPDYIRGVVG